MKVLNWTFGYNNWTRKEEKKVSFLSIFWNCGETECIFREDAAEHFDCEDCKNGEPVRVRYEAVVDFFISDFVPPPAYKGFKGCPGQDDCLACKEDIRGKKGACSQIEFIEASSDVEILALNKHKELYAPIDEQTTKDKFEEQLAKIIRYKSHFCSQECLNEWAKEDIFYL